MFSITHLKGQGGFTFIEVIVATLLFTASVVGVAGMMIAGGTNITRGAQDSTAAKLAAQRIEEVKSLQYYVPFEYMNDRTDVDDFYFNEGVPNGVAGDPTQHPQLDDPAVVEEYGTIPGFSMFKRTTAIEYQYVSGGSFVPAVMKTGWTPMMPISIGMDEPRGGLNASDNEELNAMVIEVTVSYQTNEGERTFKQRGVHGDLFSYGASNDPVLSVNSIDPIIGYTNDSNLLMKIYVDAVGDLNSSSSLEVRLWYPGRTDLIATGTQANDEGTEITCYFDLTGPDVVPITYNLAVYWIEEGFQDKNFRECFEVMPPDPGITDIKEYDWGYRAQPSRRVTILGASLSDPESVQLRGPVDVDDTMDETFEDSVVITGSVVSATDSKIVADFPLTSIPDEEEYFNTYWDVEVETVSNTASTDEETGRLLINPPPEATSISQTTGSTNKDYDGVDIDGKYFQDYPSEPVVRLVKDVNTLPIAEDVIYVPIDVNTGDFEEDMSYGTTHYYDVVLDLADDNFMYWNETDVDEDTVSLDGRYYMYMENADGTAVISDEVYVDITGGSATEPIVTGVVVEPGTADEHSDYHCYNDWEVPVTIYGENFNTDVSDLQARFADQYGLSGTPTVTGAFGPGQTIEGLTMNTIGLANGSSYEVRVTNTDTGEFGTFLFSITEPEADAVVVMEPGETAPAGCTWPQQNAFWNSSSDSWAQIDTVAQPNRVREDGTYDYHIIAKRMRNLNVQWWFKTQDGDVLESSAAIVKSRANCYVYADCDVVIPDCGYSIWGSRWNEDMDVKCSNDGGTTYGPVYNDRLFIRVGYIL